MKIFSLNATLPLGSHLAAELGTTLSAHEERDFEDTEFKVRPLEDVEGERVVVCHTLAGDAHHSAGDKLLRLLTFVGALKDGGAEWVCVVSPYLAFSRKERRTNPGDPITTRYVAAFFETVGTDAIVTADVHSLPAFENAFRCLKIHVEAAPLFADHFARALESAGSPPVVLSPDAGGMKRAQRFAEALGQRLGARVELALMEKSRKGGRVGGEAFAGNVEGRDVLVIDDLISGGTTVARAAEAATRRGAASVHVAATHAVFSAEAAERLRNPALRSIVVTDTAGDPRLRCPALARRLTVLDSAPLLAAALRRFASR